MAQPTANDPFSWLVSTDHAYFKSFLSTIFDFIDVTASSDPGAVKATIQRFVSEISSHTSVEEQLIHGLYVPKLGAQGQAFLDDALQGDNRDKKVRICSHKNIIERWFKPSGVL